MSVTAMLDCRLLVVERLVSRDLELLAALRPAETSPARMRSLLLTEPGATETFLGHPGLFDLVFGEGAVLDAISPALVFSALVHRAVGDLETMGHVPEWVGPGERLPVFDVASLRHFAEDPGRRYVMIELLASFTRVASGSTWVRGHNGYRRRRYSELDPVSLAEMVEGLPASERAGGYRRLGDVALFLTGVCPDHTARHPLTPGQRARLAEAMGVRAIGEDESLALLEQAGRRWYSRAATGLGAADVTLQDLAANFTPARRFLNYLADRYLYRLETGTMNPVSP